MPALRSLIVLLGSSVFLLPVTSGNASSDVLDGCRFGGKKLYGKVKIVEHFPDFKVKVVEHFPDLKVQVVEHFPDACGKWQIVEHFPDFTIQLVEHFPDFKIRYVEHFPGTD